MSHLSRYTHLVAAFAIGTISCVSYGASDQPPTVQTARETLSDAQDTPRSPPPDVGQNPTAGTNPEFGPITKPAASPSMSPSSLKATLADATVVSKLRSSGLQLASIAGVSMPDRMYVVAVSDHQSAETILSGANINDHSAVYVIVMTGGPFTAFDHPQGVDAPQGNVLTATINAATFNVTDLGIVHVEPDLATIALGTVDLQTK